MENIIKIFLCGDVMTGRGIDQILPFSNDPTLYESYIKNANGYVKLAEKVNGSINKPVDFKYIWGDALNIMKEADVRILNLETSITTSKNHEEKGINYRMHPKNIECLKEADINCCALANNHVLDWGNKGLLETVETLKKADIAFSGAGKDIAQAEKPGIIQLKNKGRVVVFSFGFPSSGIPLNWKATNNKPGINLLTSLSKNSVKHISNIINKYRQTQDIIIASIHWDSNWGYAISDGHQKFARDLIDLTNVDIVHGHSSHHFKGIEIYNQKPIIYGCGDFINDYEGIGGYEHYRGDLGLIYLLDFNILDKKLVGMQLIPTQIKRFQVVLPSIKDLNWAYATLRRECKKLGTTIEQFNEQTLMSKLN